VARILIVGGGCRGLRLAERLYGEGSVVRIVTRKSERRGEIEAVGAECFVGDPDRLTTLGPAVEHVTLVCWLLATATGEGCATEVLHGSRLAQFLHSLIDTTVRGVVYEAGGSQLPAALLAQGQQLVYETARRNAIPLRIVRADPCDLREWTSEAQAAVQSLLADRG
jgi:hypothetical protein